MRMVQICIGGSWRASQHSEIADVQDPATTQTVARVAVASEDDIDAALMSARDGFLIWRSTLAADRQNILRKAANLCRERANAIAGLITQEQGKTLAEAVVEMDRCAQIFDWYADESRRAYGRMLPSSSLSSSQSVRFDPIGPVAAFSPWNFPASQAAKKLAAALAAGCSIILKGPEETPSPCAELVRALYDAGAPDGTVSLLFGHPAMISQRLIRSPIIRKVSFTGSIPVGKQLASLAGSCMKPCTMELGGHAPVIVCGDADVARLVPRLASMKFRNAGQVCVSPSRFFVHESIYSRFVKDFSDVAREFVVGDGRCKGVQMGPMANARRVSAMHDLVADAIEHGARLVCGGTPDSRPGCFFPPTVLCDVPERACLMQEEIFGPVVPFAPFASLDEVLEKSNATGYGLAAYAFTSSSTTASQIADSLDCGIVSINQLAGSAIEMPFGGRKDSGYGSEGGPEGLFSYLVPKSVSVCSVIAR